jgi:hypothetical protein
MRRADIEVPSEIVDVDSWISLACYPRGNFYPLSFGPTKRNRRVTMTCFRNCSTCRSHSKAPLCHYTRCAISIRAEGTFVRLRYSLGGDRPSQTTHQAMSFGRIHGTKLDIRLIQGGISRLAPPELAPRHQRLPPILHKTNQRPRPSCSKAPRGLFVLLRVPGIFTGVATSPRPSPRHSPDRYAIRAGRNLPDKEFRYLRTVIVTAAVYWGFSRKLCPKTNPLP